MQAQRFTRFAVAFLVALLGANAIGWAHSASSGVIVGCRSAAGYIRGIDESGESCRNGDVELTWYTKSGADAAGEAEVVFARLAAG